MFAFGIGFGLAVWTPTAAFAQAARPSVRVERLLDRPIITPQLDASIGPNIQGPSLIGVPGWVDAPLGKYYLYFAAHKGTYIRLAYADNLRGPWRVHKPGSLPIQGSFFLTKPPDAPPAELAKLRATDRKSVV